MDFKKAYFLTWVCIYYYNNKFILKTKRKLSKEIGFLVIFLSLPYILGQFLLSIIIEKLYTPFIEKDNLKEKYKKFEYELAIVAIAKNEGPYIREWIEYHRLLGVTKFYFYDNESEDQTKEILAPYIKSKLVSYFLIKGKARQLDAYNDAIKNFKFKCRYMAFIDLDEYLMPTEPFKPIIEIVNEAIDKYGKGASGIGINWAIYGSSQHYKTPEGLITQVFNHRGKNDVIWNAHIKTICNPRRIKDYISPHYPLYKLGAYSVNETGEMRLYTWFCLKQEYTKIRINHYFTKSKEQFIKKISRGLADRIGNYEEEQFVKYDLNDIKDTSMEIYAKKLNQVLNKNIYSKREEK